MESRKDQLQKQIAEAIKANDIDLYSLLKSQWAHRFGVESLEVLENLELNIVNQKLTNEENQKNDQLQDYSSEVAKEIHIDHSENTENEIKNETELLVKSTEVENKESLEINSQEKTDKELDSNKVINPVRQYQSPPKVEALIPLPPKPKYSYLRKWLLTS